MHRPVKVLVTGEHGFIGTALCNRILEYQDGFDLFQPVMTRFKAEDDAGWTSNVTSRPEISMAIERADVIIHLAARKGSWFCDEDISDTINVNLLGAIQVAQLCRLYNKPLMYFGTTAWYESTDQPIMLDEYAGYNPQTIYGLTKQSAEKTIDQMEDLKLMIIRPVYGYGNIGKYSASRSESWMDIVLTQIAAQRTEPLQTDLGGAFIKDYTHISDIVDATIALLTKFLDEEFYGRTIQVGAGGNYHFDELMEAFKAPFQILFDSNRDYKKHQPHDYSFLRRVLPDWRPRVDALEYARTRGRWVNESS